jgi:hypothetical protein
MARHTNANQMLGSDRSRGYCLEMICADFLAGANLDDGDPETLLFSMTRFFKFLPENQRQVFLENVSDKAS